MQQAGHITFLDRNEAYKAYVSFCWAPTASQTSISQAINPTVEAGCHKDIQSLLVGEPHESHGSVGISHVPEMAADVIRYLTYTHARFVTRQMCAECIIWGLIRSNQLIA